MGILYHPTTTPTQRSLAKAHAERIRRMTPAPCVKLPDKSPPERDWLHVTSSGEKPGEKLTAAKIIHSVEVVGGLEEGVLASKSRTVNVIPWRFLACYLIREMLPWQSTTQIGRALNRDHTSVMHAVSRAAAMLATNPDYVKSVAAVRDLLHE